MLSQPHDALFKHVFGQPVHAADLFRLILPSQLTEQIDFASLQLAPGSFVDEALSERHTDLLFSTSTGEPSTLLYLLFEHQSRVDPLMPFRLLRYIIRIQEHWLTDHSDTDKIPAVIPIVLYHGTKPWTAPRQFLDILDLPSSLREATSGHLPSFRYFLEDLSSKSDSDAKNHSEDPKAQLALLLLKHARTRDLLARIRDWIDLFAQLFAAREHYSGLEPHMVYILSTRRNIDSKTLADIFEPHLGSNIREEIMSTGKTLIEQGIEQGLERGRTEEARSLLLRLLLSRFGDLPIQDRARVKVATLSQIHAWIDRFLTAETPDDLFGAR